MSGMARLSTRRRPACCPTDAHRPRGVAAAEAVRRVAPDVDLAPLRPGTATFAVLVGFAAPAALTALSYGTRRLAHLAVTVRDGTVVVGPLVRPGRTPCLNCLDLHRRDRDPAWPAIAAQLQTTPPTRPSRWPRPPCWPAPRTPPRRCSTTSTARRPARSAPPSRSAGPGADPAAVDLHPALRLPPPTAAGYGLNVDQR